MEYAELAIAGGGFFAIHVGISGTAMRDRIALRLGDRGFQIIYSILSFLLLIWMIGGYRNAPSLVLWDITVLKMLPVVVGPIATIFLVAAYSSPNATGVGGEGVLKGENPDRGIFRVTRHPLLVGIALWASAHMMANGDVASLMLFGALLATCLLGPASIDAKLRRRAPEDFERLAAVTSIIPFAAIAQGRTRFSLSEIGLLRIVAGLGLYAGLYYFHEYFGGVALAV